MAGALRSGLPGSPRLIALCAQDDEHVKQSLCRLGVDVCLPSSSALPMLLSLLDHLDARASPA